MIEQAMDRTAEELTDAPRRGLQSVGVAAEVLLALAAGDGPVSLGELARRTGMPGSKLHRYLASFIDTGLVVQEGRSGAYDLGRAAIDIGLAAMGRSQLVNQTADALPDLAREAEATALLCIWGPSGITIVRIERSEFLVVTTLALGSRLPLLTSATGHAFLAHLPPPETAEQVAAERAKLPADRRPDDATIERLRAEVRHTGVGRVQGQFIPGLAAVAAPVLNWQHRPEAAVTLIGTDPAIADPDGPAAEALLRLTRTVGWR